VFSIKDLNDSSFTPESVEISAYIFDAGGVQLIDAPVTNQPIKDQVGVLQHAEMLGYGGPANRKAFGDLVHCRRAFAQTLKNRQSGWISQRAQGLDMVKLGIGVQEFRSQESGVRSVA
jgi:hypothetical protein